MISLRFSVRIEAAFLALMLALAAALSPSGALAQAQSKGPAPAAQDAPSPATPAPPADATSPPAPMSPPAPVLSADDQAAMEEIRAPATKLKSTLETLEKSVERNMENDEALWQLRIDLLALVDGAQAMFDALKPKAESLRQLSEKLGPAPEKDAAPESEQVASERARLNAIVAEVNGALKAGELTQVRARQLLATVQTARQGLFAKQILKRSPSPVFSGTWTQLLADIPSATRQISYSMSAWVSTAQRKWMELASLAAGLVVLFVALSAIVRWFVGYRLDRPRETPPGFFEQAAAIGWVAPLLALPPLAALGVAAAGLEGLGLLVYDVGQIAKIAFPALVLFIAVAAITRAILSPRRADWRAVDLSTPAARKIARIITLVAAVFSLDVIVQEAIQRLYLPLSISIMESALASVAIALLMLQMVRTPFERKSAVGAVSRPSAGESAVAGGGPEAAPVVPASAAAHSRLRPYLIKIPLLVAALAILALTLSGYISLGRFITTQVVVTGSAIAVVLVFHLAIRALLGEPGTGIKPLSSVLEEHVGLDADQSTALTRTLSFVLNAGLALVALPLILITWGYSLSEALSWLRAAVFGFEIGDFRISLARIFIAVGLFLALVFVTRLAQRWLDTGVLQSRRLDQGIANSIRTGVGYTGFIVAALAAVSYGGLDITNFAIVAGALSVGIGFGLQSIINNFVSGLILLVERPIKVGDRVSVKGQEGFVRRISVRSTEIETIDKASLIVPNSEFITSTVTNWTHRNALGTATVRVSVAYKSDPERVREVLQKVGAECPLILQHPAPGIGFDGFGANGLDFSISAVIPDVTKAATVQTDLRFRILKAFREAGIEMPHAQYDVHLRDLDIVRTLLARLAEERARQAGPTIMDPKPGRES
jgi:small-conductance mechanosensitive channel